MLFQMTFEPFAPIDLPFKSDKKEKKEDELTRLRRELELLKRENKELKNLIERLKFAQNSERRRFEEEKKHLLTQLENLKTENLKLKELTNQLQAEIENLIKQNEELKKTALQFLDKLNKTLRDQKENLLNLTTTLVGKVVKELLKKDEVWDEETLRGIFEEIFSQKLFRGEITVKANPQDIELLKEILSQKSDLVFDIIPDPSLGRGEFEAETEKFFVERDLDQLVDEIVPFLLKELLKDKEKPQTATEEQTEH